MNYTDIPAQLTSIHAALVEKLQAQPFMEPSMTCRQNGDWSINLYGPWCKGDYKVIFAAKGNSPHAAITSAINYIADMPDPETAAKQKWHGKLADVIDEGHALALPDAVMQPLRQGSQAMTENLLAAPEGV
jgi:hypothetical protein